MQKRDNTKQQRSADHEIENLAVLISEILSNPRTPDILSNKIMDALCDLNSSAEIWENPHAVEALLMLHNAKNGAH